MGEAARTKQGKLNVVIERLNNRNQQLYLAVAEVAVYRTMAGPIDPTLYRTIMAKMEGVEYADIEVFFNAVMKAAKERMLELDIAEQHQAAAATAETHDVVTSDGTRLIVPGSQNQIDQLLAGMHNLGMSTPTIVG